MVSVLVIISVSWNTVRTCNYETDLQVGERRGQIASGTRDLGIEYRIKDLGIFCDRSCADNVFRLKAVLNIKRLFGPKPIASTMKEEPSAMLA